MTTRRDSLLYPQPVPTVTGRGVLVDIEGAYVPGLLSLLESRKYGASWDDGAVWGDGAKYYTKLQWEMLMDASDRIIDEIRQTRGALNGQELVPTDPTVTAVYPGVSLRQLLYDSTSGLEGVNEKLMVANDLLTQIAAGGNSDEKLDIIIGLLAAL